MTWRARLERAWEDALVALFVDNTLVYRLVSCHRLGSRSFFVRRRQFHVCARCTGLLVGAALCPLSLLWSGAAPYAFAASLVALAADGGTQLLGWRESTNALRFATGLATTLQVAGCLAFAVSRISAAL